MMDRARAIAGYGLPSVVFHSLGLQNLSYAHEQNQYQHYLTNVEYGVDKQEAHPLSSRLNASIPCPISISCLDYSINVNRVEPEVEIEYSNGCCHAP
jgi:hypothetical protein